MNLAQLGKRGYCGVVWEWEGFPPLELAHCPDCGGRLVWASDLSRLPRKRGVPAEQLAMRGVW